MDTLEDSSKRNFGAGRMFVANASGPRGRVRRPHATSVAKIMLVIVGDVTDATGLGTVHARLFHEINGLWIVDALDTLLSTLTFFQMLKALYVGFAVDHNLLSVSHIRDKKSTLFANKKSVILGPGFKETEKDTILWHKRMGHVHICKLNRLTANNLVDGVSLKHFKMTDHCVACKKGKQKKKSHPLKYINSIDTPLEHLHMDLFGPVNRSSIPGDLYCLVVVNNYSRLSWVLFTSSKDQTLVFVRNLSLRSNNFQT
ncbi:uncharacterized protein LOC143568213 [Bidens hawaiensis]|uniref:uncharacterized protein LOC143568213 n=1 Tax=Bidens hawaiensis TaxID=980011 RepID=UPI00404A6A7A